MKSERFTVLYRWRLREGLEEQFVNAWNEVTEFHIANSGSFGSRLHRGGDGTWYAYAQWPSAEARKAAFSGNDLIGAGQAMSECVEERFDEVVLQIESDLLQ